jgi:hypothetical protein
MPRQPFDQRQTDGASPFQIYNLQSHLSKYIQIRSPSTALCAIIDKHISLNVGLPSDLSFFALIVFPLSHALKSGLNRSCSYYLTRRAGSINNQSLSLLLKQSFPHSQSATISYVSSHSIRSAMELATLGKCLQPKTTHLFDVVNSVPPLVPSIIPFT